MTTEDFSDLIDETKAEIYEAMAVINRAFAQITTALYGLESKGILGEDYAFNQEIPVKALAAKINCDILAKVTEREQDDRNHYGRMRANMERKRK